MVKRSKSKKKQRSSRGYYKRSVGNRELRQRFLIVCEGKATEKNYFEKFRVTRLEIIIKGLGCNPLNLVKGVQMIVDKGKKDDDQYHQVWCVFDRDEWLPEDFNSAIRMAEAQGWHVAYSNEAFELWYILHFEFLNTGLSRKNYSKKLTQYLGQPYEKNSHFMYDMLMEHQNTAIANAERLLEEYEPPNPEKDNPSTTVHLLVKELNKHTV
ncbi:MAG: RloB domain-containing protein [Cyanothece sp. SIO2G6]|nr:RloB domain-containing protein [Cyanothece sp. SIO2G6]